MGCDPPPSKVQGSSSRTMISEQGVTPLTLHKLPDHTWGFEIKRQKNKKILGSAFKFS